MEMSMEMTKINLFIDKERAYINGNAEILMCVAVYIENITNKYAKSNKLIEATVTMTWKWWRARLETCIWPKEVNVVGTGWYFAVVYEIVVFGERLDINNNKII